MSKELRAMTRALEKTAREAERLRDEHTRRIFEMLWKARDDKTGRMRIKYER